MEWMGWFFAGGLVLGLIVVLIIWWTGRRNQKDPDYRS